MWANTCWGLFGLAVTLGLAMVGLPSEYVWLQPWFLCGAVVSLAASALCFSWPLWARLYRPGKSVAEITATITMLDKAHAEAVTLVAVPDSDFHRNRRASWTMDTLRMMKQLDMPKHEIFLFQHPDGSPDQDKCLGERKQLLRSLVAQYMKQLK